MIYQMVRSLFMEANKIHQEHSQSDDVYQQIVNKRWDCQHISEDIKLRIDLIDILDAKGEDLLNIRIDHIDKVLEKILLTPKDSLNEYGKSVAIGILEVKLRALISVPLMQRQQKNN